MKNSSLIFLGSCLLCAHSAAAQDPFSLSGLTSETSASTAKEQTATTEQQDASTTTKTKSSADSKVDQPATATPAGSELDSPVTDLGTGFYRGLGGGGRTQVSGPPSRMVSTDNVIITWSEENDQLRGFSLANGKWTILDVPTQKQLVPIVGNNVAAVKLKNGMAAYSAETQRWAILSLPEQSKAFPTLSNSLITVYDSDHIYTFAASNGRWTSPTDKALEETKEVIPTGNLTYSKQQIDEAVKGLSVIVSNSRSALTVRGAKKDVEEFRQRLSKLKPSVQAPWATFNGRSPGNPSSVGRGTFQPTPPVQLPPRGNDSSPTNSLTPRTSTPGPISNKQPAVTEWVQPQPNTSPRQVLNSPSNLSRAVAPRFNPNANQSPAMNAFSTPGNLPASNGLAAPPQFPATAVPYGVAAGSRFSNSFFSRPPASKSEASSLELAKNLRRKQDQQPLTDADKAALHNLVSAALTQRLQAQQKSVDELRKKLKAVEQKLKTKTDNKQKIIDRRVDELLNPELDWDAVSTKGRRSEFPESFFSGSDSSSGVFNPPDSISSTLSNRVSKVKSDETPRFRFTDTLATRTTDNQPRLISGRAPTQIPDDLAGMAMQLRPVLARAKKSVAVANRKLTQIQDDRKKTSDQFGERKAELEDQSTTKELSSKDQQFLSAIELSLRKLDEVRDEYEEIVVTDMRNWKSAWQQFQGAMELQKARVEVANAVVKNEAKELERMESLFSQNAIPQKSVDKARIQKQLAELQLRTHQETLAQFERILKAEPELDPDYSASKDQPSDPSPNLK